MKIVELTNNLTLPISNEEHSLLKKFIGDTPVPKKHLSEREQLIANQLTVKDILRRVNQDGKIYYSKRIH